jgi:hypothetical protein
MATKRGFLLALAASASIGAICPAFAEVYPARPITIVDPFPAGGPVDAVGRILAERMRASLGKPLIIENVAGAGGTIGMLRLKSVSQVQRWHSVASRQSRCRQWRRICSVWRTPGVRTSSSTKRPNTPLRSSPSCSGSRA